MPLHSSSLGNKSKTQSQKKKIVVIIQISCDDRVDRKSTRLNCSHLVISYAVFCLKKKKGDWLKSFKEASTFQRKRGGLLPGSRATAASWSWTSDRCAYVSRRTLILSLRASSTCC